MSSKQWRCSLRMLSKWWPGGHRVWTFTVLLLLHRTGRRNGTYWSILLNATISQSGEKFPWDCLFSPMGLAPPIPVSTLVKDQGVQTDNMFPPSAQGTESANKARRLIFMIRCSFQDLSKSAFIPLYGAEEYHLVLRETPQPCLDLPHIRMARWPKTAVKLKVYWRRERAHDKTGKKNCVCDVYSRCIYRVRW